MWVAALRIVAGCAVVSGVLVASWDTVRESIYVDVAGNSLLGDPFPTQCGLCWSLRTETDQGGGRCRSCGAVWRYGVRPDRDFTVHYLSDGELSDVGDVAPE